MMNGLQALPQWQDFMDHPTGAWLGFVNAVQSLGAFLCYPVIAWLNNHFGRKKTIGVGYFWLLLGCALQAGAQNHAMFVLGRLFIGGTTAFYSASAPLLIAEVAYPTHPGIVTALYNTGWYVGKSQSLPPPTFQLDLTLSKAPCSLRGRLTAPATTPIPGPGAFPQSFNVSSPSPLPSATSSPLNPHAGSYPKAAMKKPAPFSSNTTPEAMRAPDSLP
jgi:hypothetical protein